MGHFTSPLSEAEFGSAARWRTAAIVLAVVCAFLVGLLLLIVAADRPPPVPAPSPKGALAESGAAASRFGRVEGVIRLAGTPRTVTPGADTPRAVTSGAAQPAPARGEARHVHGCKPQPIEGEAVLVNDGRLKDVLVRIESGGVKGDYSPPDEHAAVAFSGCALTPRIQGALLGQELELQSGDPLRHEVHAARGGEAWFQKSLPQGAAPHREVLDVLGVVRLTCDLHPWERAFVVVTDHPFFAVTGVDGAFALSEIPVGRYQLEAWHARYGRRRVVVEIGESPAVVGLTYETSDLAPESNQDEAPSPP